MTLTIEKTRSFAVGADGDPLDEAAEERRELVLEQAAGDVFYEAYAAAMGIVSPDSLSERAEPGTQATEPERDDVVQLSADEYERLKADAALAEHVVENGPVIGEPAADEDAFYAAFAEGGLIDTSTSDAMQTQARELTEAVDEEERYYRAYASQMGLS